jgi:hypothetical protein
VAQNVTFADRLIESGVPVGYGGRIYNRLPALQNKMPGYFLGEDLFHIVSRVREVFINPSLALKAKPELPEDYQPLLGNFNQHVSQIEERVGEWGMREGLESEHIEYANQSISEGIRASLSLGEIDLLAHESDWVKGFLSHRGVPKSDISAFFQVYADSAAGELGEPGRVIVGWLEEESGRVE